MQLHFEKIDTDIEFDMWLYAELSGETRIDNNFLTFAEPLWNKWLENLHVHSLKTEENEERYLLIYLDTAVDDEIDKVWKESPSDGLNCHNLAICMVMSVAKALIPELEQGRCAPMPTPVGEVQDAFDEVGLEWDTEGTLNHKYVVFTHKPYAGGCDLCFLEESCPKSSKPKDNAIF